MPSVKRSSDASRWRSDAPIALTRAGVIPAGVETGTPAIAVAAYQQDKVANSVRLVAIPGTPRLRWVASYGDSASRMRHRTASIVLQSLPNKLFGLPVRGPDNEAGR